MPGPVWVAVSTAVSTSARKSLLLEVSANLGKGTDDTATAVLGHLAMTETIVYPASLISTSFQPTDFSAGRDRYHHGGQLKSQPCTDTAPPHRFKGCTADRSRLGKVPSI